MAQTEWPIVVTDNASPLFEKAAALISKHGLEPGPMPSALSHVETEMKDHAIHVTVHPSADAVSWFLDLIDLAARSS